MSDEEIWGPPPSPGAPPPPPAATPPPAAGPSGVEPPPPPATPAATPTPSVSTPIAEVEPEPAPTPRGRSRAMVAVGVVGVLAVLGAGGFAVAQMADDGDSGGADTPEEAAEAMFVALDQEDLLGVVDVLLPGERETFRGPATHLFDELRRVEVLSDGADPSAIDGVDVQVDVTSVSVQPTNVDDIVGVDVSGTAGGSIDGEALPIGDLITDNVDVDRAAMDTASDTEPFDVHLTAVEQDGRWYISLFYSAAEELRTQASGEEPLPIPEQGVTPVGAASPEDAMDNVVEAVEQLDVEAMIASLNPQEFEALQRYAPLFLDDAQQAIDEAGDVDISIDDPVYDVSGSGSTRSVTVRELHGSVSAEGESATFDYADGCIVLTTDEDTIDTCELADDQPALEDMFGEEAPAVQDFVEVATTAFDDYESPGFIVEEVDDAWYVSPMATMAEQFFAVSEALDRGEIEDLIDAGEAAAEDLFGSVLEDSAEVFGEDVVPDDLFGTDTSDVPTETAVPAPVESVPADTTVESAPVDTATVDTAGADCYFETDADAAAACFQALIDSGDVDPISVPIYLRHPECGLAESYWSGDFYSLPDNEFIAVVEPAAQCFQDLVAKGELTPGDLPYELSDPECLEGRNWYTAVSEDDDDTYLQRLIACVSE